MTPPPATTASSTDVWIDRRRHGAEEWHSADGWHRAEEWHNGWIRRQGGGERVTGAKSTPAKAAPRQDHTIARQGDAEQVRAHRV